MESAIKFENKTSIWKLLAILTALFIVTTIIFVILFAVFYVKYKDQQDNAMNICKTPACYDSASQFVSTMNMTVDPCSDFNEYACGRFIRDAVIPVLGVVTSSSSVIKNNNDLTVKEIISEEIVQGEPMYLTKLKTYYKSCKNTDSIKKIGLTLFLKEPLSNEWPTLGQSNVTYNLNDIITQYSIAGTNPLYSLEVGVDIRNNSVNVISLWQNYAGDTSLHDLNPSRKKKRSFDNDFLNKYTQLAVFLGADPIITEKDAGDVHALVQALKQIYVPKDEWRNESKRYNPVTLSQLSVMYPNLYISEAAKSLFRTVNITLQDDEKIINVFPSYIGNLSQLLQSYSKRTIHNLFAYSYADARISEIFELLNNKTTDQNSDVQAREAKWIEYCIPNTSNSFFLGVSKQFVKKAFNETSKKFVEEMVVNIKKSFRKMLEENTWILPNTKVEALKKLDAMKPEVGYPDVKFQDKDIENYYSNYPLLNDTYYANQGLLRKLKLNRMLSQLRKPVEKYRKLDPMLWDFNAYYDPMENNLIILAGILQKPTFSTLYENYYNYGKIGMVIGHEISHGFDDRGSQFDADGNLRNWWQEADLKTFTNKTKCIVDQNSNFFDKEANMSLNGINTQGESISDTTGIIASYRAYKELVQQNGASPVLPFLGLNPDQLFFVSFAQGWCRKMTPEALINKIKYDEHPPDKYRILGTLQNSEDFAKAFNCPIGSYMNPEKKCRVW